MKKKEREQIDWLITIVPFLLIISFVFPSILRAQNMEILFWEHREKNLKIPFFHGEQ